MLFMIFEALRERRRDWRTTVSFCGVLGSALTLAVAGVSVAGPRDYG